MIQKAKRTLAMLMAAVMLCGLLPVSAMATTTEQDPVDATTTPVVTEQPEATEQPAATETPAPSETVLPTEQPEETLPDEDTPTAGLPEEVVEPYALTYEELLASTAQQDQPFASDTLGSDNFRIPALVTLDNGTLVAAADARWDGTYDGKNVDTMVAVSKDNGQSWTTSLVNYFADTEDKQTSGAASFIDPALATDGENVYLLVDVFPGGVDLLSGTCQAGTGYNENGLMLKKSGESEYSYYVGEFTNDYAPVMSSDGTESGYAVDERYNLYTVIDGKYTAVSYHETGDNGAYIAANVFYENAEFTVYPTSYLWLVKSEDGGETWSAPQILNPQVKGEDEVFYGVGPGRGLVAEDGTIYFSCYYHDGSELGASSQRSSLIYSKDDGATWKRTENLQSSGSSSSKWSSENQVVQLDDGTIRMFYRNGRGLLCYADLNGDGWSAPTALDPDGDHICSNCQLSVIHYSKKINGKESVVVSCPAKYTAGITPAVSGSRENGKIFVFTLDENNTMSVAYTYELTAAGEYFAYSCLTELENGDIGILYENGDASITYEKISLNAILGQDESEFPQITENGSILAGTELSMKQDDAAKTLNVALEEGQILSAASSNDAVLKAEVGENGTFTLTPVGEGTAVVTLTITSAAGVQSRNASADLTKTLQITVTAPAVATYGFIGNTGNDNTGKGKTITKLTTNVGQKYSVLLNVPTDGQSVEWTSDNPGVATVNNGTITATGQGAAIITATVKNSDGTTAGTATMTVSVIRGEPGGIDIARSEFNFYIAEISDTTVYYSLDATKDLVQAQQGEVFYLSVRLTDPLTLAFFGAPNDGYALTYMKASNSSGAYHPLHKDGKIELNDTDYFFAADIGKKIFSIWDDAFWPWDEDGTKTQDMVNSAISKGCDGGMGFTKPSAISSNPDCTLFFRSEKLPTLTKTVESVNGLPYTEGMVAHVGDEVVFQITVTKYASQTGITYTNAIVNDTALGINFSQDISNDLNGAGTGAKTLTYDVTYIIKDGDWNQPIENTADLTYHYQSQYSTGAMSSSATAEASITAAEFDPGSYVVDFGLPVTFDFTGVEKPGDFVKGYSATGVADVVVQGDKVTYTLKKAMTEPDTVILTDEYNGTNSFIVYPATTVYYDASFVEGLTDKSTSGLKYQTATAVGEETFNYGYEAGYSNSVSGKLPKDKTATFTFTGTGVDIYTNPTSNSCYVAVRIYKDEELVQLYVVDTAMKSGNTNATQLTGEKFYNVPIVSELGLKYGTYTVEIERVNPDRYNSGASAKRTDVTLNGFRVYGTLESDTDGVYTKDGEASPTFTQLRDVLINTLWKTHTPSADLNKQYDQVYANPKESNISANIEGLSGAADAQDLLINGPKNEIYLTNGQTLTITVPTSGEYQIGLKALDKEKGTVEINGTGKNVTNVDMFYKVNGTKITIKNTGDAMIAVTYLKKTV